MLCGLDWALYSAFDTIRHHSFLQYSFRSERRPGDIPPAKFPPRFFQLCHLLLGSTLWPCNPTVATGPLRPTPFVSAAGRGGKSAAEGRGGFSALTSPRSLHTDFPDTRPAPL